MRPSVAAMLAALGLALAAAGCADPVHDQAVSNDGPEDPSVPAGATHRPGQPCLDCHGGSGPASSQFTVGGTVYQVAYSQETGQPSPLQGAEVQMTDVNGSEWHVPTNETGNFFVSVSEWNPTFPMTIQVIYKSALQNMTTHVSRAVSCADCHKDPPGSRSPGHVYIAYKPSDLPGGT